MVSEQAHVIFHARLQVLKYINLVEVNWTPEKLNMFIILGQSLKHFTQHFGMRKSKYIMNNEQILCEISMPETDIEQDGSNPSNEVSIVDPDQTHPMKFPLNFPNPSNEVSTVDTVYTEAFNGLSWHFLNWDRSFSGVDLGDVRSFFGWDRLWSI